MAPSEAGLVRRTIWLLRAVAAHPEGVGLSEVAREAGIPKATCYRVLTVLERESWLTLDPVTRRYRVSLGLLSIVGGLLDGGGAYGHMREVLRNLAEETRETAGFDVLLPPKVMVVAQAPGPSLIGQTLKPVPRTQPVWATSTGKVLLAALSPDAVRADFTEEFAEHAPPEVGTWSPSWAHWRRCGTRGSHSRTTSWRSVRRRWPHRCACVETRPTRSGSAGPPTGSPETASTPWRSR
ncbi:DNA-binding IclR family transcriptional regulator [Micromonospora olivasterospora]|uniref:DNA-binding IclR family transcriptional regulator n=1 Tax=Micromonospora olivasterospora TaxID=1880 RepID=A0A562I4Q9_MICOL|nr:helix-turn-helix domain-containing protein [Micromonospora olivasterospora]TWH65942.1 DNA-binding IclR family transcriptional regulator [Micromonospora olivasterospora]